MATPIELEPEPHSPSSRWVSPCSPTGRRHALPRPVEPSDRPFFEVLRALRSTPGRRAITEGDLSNLLWHSMMIRERRPAREGYLDWESRVCPSAGGLHPIDLVCLPVGGDLPQGLYDPRHHEIVVIKTQAEPLTAANAISVKKLCGATSGITLQFVADRSKVDAAYRDGGSLLWRDAGALTATLSLTAEALGLAAAPLGRTGHRLLTLAGLSDERWLGVGATHLTARH